MKTLFNVVKVLSVAALVSSCAYENDPGLAPKADPNAKPTVSDPYAKLAAPALLTAKYKTLTADCSVSSKLADAADDAAAETEGAGPAPADQPAVPPKPVDEQGARTVINWIDQQKVDAELKNEVPTQMVLEIKPAEDQPVESTVTIKLASKPVAFTAEETKTIGKKVYVLKHSPKMAASVTFTMAGKGAMELEPVDVEITEGIPMTKVWKTGADAEKRAHTLTCMLKGDVNDKPEAQGQWLMVDCEKPADDYKDKPAEKAIYATNCPKDQAPPAAQPPTK